MPAVVQWGNAVKRKSANADAESLVPMWRIPDSCQLDRHVTGNLVGNADYRHRFVGDSAGLRMDERIGTESC